MVCDALTQLVKWGRVQDLRSFSNTKEEVTRLLDFAECALSYFERAYDFPQEEAFAKLEEVREILNDEDLCAEAMLAEIGEVVGDGEEE
jgi:inorganic triphosphatase YgiF